MSVVLVSDFEETGKGVGIRDRECCVSTSK